MDSLSIKSYCGDYRVYFDDNIDFRSIIDYGDLIIVDKIVYGLYRHYFGDAINDSNAIIIDATEEQKSYAGIGPIIKEIIDRGFHKNNYLIAIGGGIVQDVVAFIASILYRGVGWRLIPTTLLAQCDSCIGSKTSVNFLQYKNQIGGFYPPREIYISSRFLKSLHEKEMKSGLGEMLHYYVVGGEDDFRMFSDNCKKALNDPSILQRLIRRSLEIKKGYIEIDEFDKKERQIFNYGHSFGHVIESISQYTIPHGIAVSHGIDIANYVAVRMGILKEETRQQIRDIACLFWSEGELDDYDFDTFLNLLKRDKKNKGNRLGIILCSGLGQLNKHMIEPDEQFCEIIKDYFCENGVKTGDMNYKMEMNLAKDAAIAAGEYLLTQQRASVDSLLGKDVKLRNDKESEEIIIDKLTKSGIPVIAEEGGASGNLGGVEKLCWIVDPLDGSANFMKEMRDLTCVSVALWENDKPILGVIYRYDRGELFSGIVGEGAYLNDQAIRTSDTSNVENAVLATGFPIKRSYSEHDLMKFISSVQRFKKIRMLGAAALMGAYVACGRVDAYTEENIMIWDIAAASAIVQAAGGCVNVERLDETQCICELFANKELYYQYCKMSEGLRRANC